jgi:alpha-L-rhamnosidase
MGWTGDAQFFMPTAAYIADVGAFFTKWLVDLVQDSQAEDGGFADIAPNLDLGQRHRGLGRRGDHLHLQ